MISNTKCFKTFINRFSRFNIGTLGRQISYSTYNNKFNQQQQQQQNQEYQQDNSNNNNNNKNNNSNNNNNFDNNKEFNKFSYFNKSLIYSFSIASLFGSKKEEPNPYQDLVTREKGKTIETFDEALEWYTRYYIQPEPEQFIRAIKFLLGSQSKQFVRQQLNNVREESDMKSIARISTIQAFYYLPLVGFMSEMFKQNPQHVEAWYKELTTDKEISTLWKNSLGDLDSVMLINLAISLANTPQTKIIEERIVSQFYSPKDSEDDKKSKLTQFQNWAAKQKKDTQSLPLILIGEYFASGNLDLVKRVVSVWRRSLDSLEMMGLQSTPGSNTSNNVAKRLEFENRDILIDQLNQSIRLLVNDKRAVEVLKTEISHQIKQKEERVKNYK